MSGSSRVVAWVVAIGLAIAIGGLSQLSLSVGVEDVSTLRLSWRHRGEVVENCRTRSDEELERLPVHMRESEACERRASSYRLLLEIDGEVRLDERIEPAGVRADRPLVVFGEFSVPPGLHEVAVRFAVEGGDASGGVAADEAPGPGADGRARPLTLNAEILFAPTEIVLVTLDPEGTGLVMRRGP